MHERLGDRLRIAISGGAPLAKEIAEFFDALGITILEGYGLTECTSAATVNRATRYRLGTVGPALPGTELRLGDDGELFIRSPTVFAGYLKDEAATREILDDDGWLSSGDIAEIDDDGFVTITDRKKDILVTAGGKNVAPANLENDLKAHPEISHALVIGDRRPFVAALVTLDPDVTASLDDEQKHARVQEIVDAVNRDRSRYEQIKRFAILPRDFSMDEGEVTPTLKLKRRVVLDHFASDVESIYRLEDAARADEARRVPAGDRGDLDDVAGVRRVDEAPAADVDPDVAEPVEEDEVARLKLVARHRHTGAVLRVARVRKGDADLLVGVHHETGAVEATR